MKLGEHTCCCAGCGRYFTGTTTFDQHRAWGDDGQARFCLDPADAKLVQRENGAWGGPLLTDEQKAELKDSFDRAKAARSEGTPADTNHASKETR